MILSLDTETTGVDWFHGARPFYVTTCDEEGNQVSFRWRVDPKTRKVDIDNHDLLKLWDMIHQADRIVGQNLKFDVHALYHAGIKDFPWHKAEDTLIAGHILASNQPHDLTSMTLHYLGEDLKPLEDALETSVQECRRMTRLKHFISDYGEIAIASDKRSDMPSAGEKTWRYDYWLPLEIAHLMGSNQDHSWYRVLEEYSDADSAATMALWIGAGQWQGMKAEMEQRGLWSRYRENMEIARITWEMELHGLTKSKSRSSAMYEDFQVKETEHENRCIEIAASTGFDLKMPKASGVNNSLREFLFDHLQVPVTRYTEGNKPSLDKEAMAEWSVTLDGPSAEFIHNLIIKRAYSSALGYLEAYDRFSVPFDDPLGDIEVIHPNLNVVGTATTRMSSSNPNGQNVGKGRDLDGEEIKLPSVRQPFGPAPGREWWCIDYDNLEMMLPAYYVGEESMIELFEKPNDPPYFGSYHLLNASIIYPDLFWPIAEKKGEFKRLYVNTWYKSLKNFGFCIQYDGGKATADAAAKREGSYERVLTSLPKLTRAKQLTLAEARKTGLVWTFPDKSIPGDRGYPLLVSRYENGQVRPTTPWNYKIQGTAGWAKKKAMIRCDKQLKEWKRTQKFDGRMVLDIHDEIVFDFPAYGRNNLSRVAKIKELMEESGRDIGIPLTVSAAYHPCNWAEEVKL